MFRLTRCGQRRSLFGSVPCSSQQDHYKVLGLAQSASQKDIKSAYYKLSKQHHPDTNPTDKEEAAKKFHQVEIPHVAMAYEILGSEDKRKAYDMTRIKSSPMPGDSSSFSNRYRRRTASNSKQYTDIDIDYKDFEHFQRSTRRRPQYHSHFDMPNEFYAEFGGFKKRVFKSEYEEAQEKHGTMYKDGRAAQREMEELRRQVEREQAAQQSRYPIPTFEQMMREKRAKEANEARQYMVGMFVTAVVAGFLTVLLSR
ncbi:CRE-DNJ-18 protein [Caenorhabditis remanei]|uniref:CRE-DNJ-18 protein n=1 Tax=Caenorhabditis remanei TaxID=31234 RepID=E3MCU4_CAERE|nr:CRE-DNJ-18 protein [Caenorhabditis remanei]